MTITELAGRLHLRTTPEAPALTVDPEQMVYAEEMGRRTWVHRIVPGQVPLACGVQSWPFWLTSPAVLTARRLDPRWCWDCWGGDRCVNCRRPSGVHAECPTCHALALDADKRIERAA